MRIEKNLILAVLILSFIMPMGLAADRKPHQSKDSNGIYAGEKATEKKVRSVSPFGDYFFFPGNNYIYWLSPDIITDIKKMDQAKTQARRKARSGSIKQMFSIMHL